MIACCERTKKAASSSHQCQRGKSFLFVRYTFGEPRLNNYKTTFSETTLRVLLMMMYLLFECFTQTEEDSKGCAAAAE